MKIYIFVKSVIDIMGALLMIILLWPLMIIIIVIIKIDSRGLAIYKQTRLGKDGREFKILKFRTMVDNAINLGTGLFTDEKDIRITSVGRILRKLSLDELPQLFNILSGDMSFIGPRPPVPYHPYIYSNYNDYQRIRFSVKPGITGLAQVTYRNSANWDKRIEKDIEYVENISLYLDLKILFRTFICVIKSKNIYLNEEVKKEAVKHAEKQRDH